MDITRRTILQLGTMGGLTLLWPRRLLADPLAGTSRSAAQATHDTAAHTASIERAFIGFRIGAPIWLNETRFADLLGLFDRHRGVTDEITFFTSETHPPLPLDIIQQRATILGERMKTARSRGYRSGINLLATIGHHEENLPHSLAGEYAPMTDPHGNICRGSFCPNDEALRSYIEQVYRALAAAEPDYIWIDDDVRLYGHMPIGACCFCETCLQRFSQRVGRVFTRDELRDALSGGPVAEQLALRRDWLEHNRQTISRLFRLIEQTVHEVVPDMPLGFMTGDRFYEGYGFDDWAEVLAGPRHTEVMWRPGGGTYTDDRLAAITDKAHDIGRQTALLPGSVRCIESELESFPYQRLKKSAHATALEAAAYIAAGCTGTAFNVLSQYDESLAEYEPLVRTLRAARPFLDTLASTLGRATSVGIHSGWCRDSYAAQNPGGPWFGGPGAPGHCNEIWSTGLPAAYHPQHAPVTAWSGDQPLALSADEIAAVLRQGVYLDGPALARLNELGYGALTGFEIVEVRHEDCIEELTDHSLNGAFAGRRRNGRQSFWKCPCYCLRPTTEGAHAVSRCVDYTYRETAACCAGVFENPEGGRVCVAGYYPYEQLQNLSKSSQLKAIMRWLSHDTLPAYIASFHRINLWVRRVADDHVAIALLNGSMDPAEDLELMIRTDAPALTFTDMRCNKCEVTCAGTDGPYRKCVVPTIGPWQIVLLTM